MKAFRVLLDTTDFMIPGIYSGIHRVAESILIELEKTDIIAVNLYRKKLYLNSNLNELLKRWNDKTNNNSSLIKFLRFFQKILSKYRFNFLDKKLTELYSYIRVLLNKSQFKSKLVISNDVERVIILINPIHRKSQIKFWNKYLSNNKNELIVLMHDLLPYFQPKLFPSSRISTFLDYLKLAQKATVIYFVSELVRLDYLRYITENYHSPKNQVLKLIDLTALVPKEKITEISIELPGDFILMVSTFEPRKNHLLFLKSVCELWERGLKFSIVLAGSSGWSNKEIWEQIDYIKGKYEGSIYVFENCSDQTLDYLYKNCLFTVYPSSFEGFGLPILESANFHKYVVCQRLPATLKIAAKYIRLFDGTAETLVYEISLLLKNNSSNICQDTKSNVVSPVFILQDCALSLIERSTE